MPTPSTCTSKKPFMELGTDNAPKLNYKLPQTNGFTANLPLKLDLSLLDFKLDAGIGTAPTSSYYSKVSLLSKENIKVNIGNAFSANISVNPIDLETGATPGYFPVGEVAGAATKVLGSTTSNTDIKIGGRPVDNVAENSLIGYPQMVVDLAGREYLTFIPEPSGVTPGIYIVEHYRVETFLGNYGAGETVKTFSLLPGEKTTITVKNYKQVQNFKKDVSNVLDSFNDESSKEFEKMLEKEADSSRERELQAGISRQYGASATVPITDTIAVGLSSLTNFNASGRTVRKEGTKTLNKTLNKQVQKSVANRKIEVNTETSTTETESEETTTLRVLENINKSRVLNFVFRQLNQELITVTYLEDVSFVFMNGYEECVQKANLSNLKNFLNNLLINPGPVFEDIINHLHNTYDYQDNHTPYVQKVTLSYENLFPITTILTQDVFVRSELIENSEVPNTEGISTDGENPISVNGVIVDITYRTLPTDSVIVDALLGQGEALDCFNLKLQDAAVAAAELENSEKQQAIDIIDGIENVTDKATLYKKVFTDCCDVPQSGCGCSETQPV